MNSDTDLSHDWGVVCADDEPVVLSYAQFRNRECVLAWRRRKREHEAAADAAASFTRGYLRRPMATLLERGA